MILFLANYYHRISAGDVNRIRFLFKPLVALIIPFILVVTQPVLGTAFLIGVGGSANTIFTAGHENRHMSIDDGQSNKTKIQGITFTKGKADNWPGGGSIVISGGSDVQVIDCVWKANIREGGARMNRNA